MIPNSYQPLMREQMAWRAAQDLKEGDYVNLGMAFRRWQRATCRLAAK